MPRPRDNDNTKGLSLDVDEFLEQERRRERALKMQDAIRRERLYEEERRAGVIDARGR
jgi:hypothetical protein